MSQRIEEKDLTWLVSCGILCLFITFITLCILLLVNISKLKEIEQDLGIITRQLRTIQQSLPSPDYSR